MIRRLAVQETGDSRYLGGPTEGPTEPLGPSQHYRIEGFKEGPLLYPIMPRHASLSDSKYKFFFQAGNTMMAYFIS